MFQCVIARRPKADEAISTMLDPKIATPTRLPVGRQQRELAMTKTTFTCNDEAYAVVG